MSCGFRKIFPLVLLCGVLSSALPAQQTGERPSQAGLEEFGENLNGVRELLHIPGMAAAIVEGERIVWERNLGFADLEAKRLVQPSTEFCIASISKTFAAVILMQLRQAGKVRLDDSIAKYVPGSSLPERTSLRAILSHTSDGKPGEEFLYNGARYALLSQVIEKTTGERYADVLSERILRPLNMDHTIPGRDALGYEELERELAKPYRWEPSHTEGVLAGELPAPGLSAATGVISTARDLARYAMALDGDGLATRENKALLFTPARSTRGETLPYGFGWFVQTYLGQRVVWHFGQETSYASLLLHIPDRKLTLIVLTNSSAMSDAFRLLDGNAARSLVALYFLKNLVLRDRLAEPAVRAQIDLDDNIDQALARLYVGRPDEAMPQVQAALTSGLLERSLDLSTLYLLMRLHNPQFGAATERIGRELLRIHPHLAPALFYLGTYYQSAGQEQKALPLFERIAAIRPPLRHWSATLALLELAKWYQGRKPEEARRYLQQIIATGYDFNGAISKAREMLRELPAR